MTAAENMKANKTEMTVHDLERLAKQAAALAILRGRSVVIDGYEIKESLRDLLKALRVDEDAVDYEDVAEALDRYRIHTGEESDSDVFIVANYDVRCIADSDFMKLLIEVDYGTFKEAVERYLREKLSSCTRAWSTAKEALQRAEDAGFEVRVTHRYITSIYTGYIEYTVKAPTGEEFKIYENVDYCNYCIHTDTFIGIQKCVKWSWEKDEKWIKAEEVEVK